MPIRHFIWILSFIFSLQINAEETTKITRSYSVAAEEIQSVKTALEGVISSQGKIIVVEKNAQIIVQDLPTQFGMIDEVVQAFNTPKPNVRIEIISTSFGKQSRQTLDVQGRTRIGGVTIGNREQNGINVDFGNNSGTNDSLNSQFLVVRSGGSAAIDVGKDIPFVDYFWSYAQGLGLLSNIQVRWDKIGSQLAIRPKVFGNQIQVEVIPQIRKLSSDFFEPEGVISFQTLQTTVTIADGGSIDIGGIAQADSEFQKRFFGFDRNQSAENTKITLKGSILK